MATTQAERNFRKSPPATLVDRLCFAAFFAAGSVIGMFVAVGLVDRGSTTLFALFAGSIAGGYGSWFIFFAISRLLSLFKRKGLSRNSGTDDA